MLGILLVAEKGSRLAGFHQGIPNKILLSLHSSCLMDYTFESIAATGVNRVIYCSRWLYIYFRRISVESKNKSLYFKAVQKISFCFQFLLDNENIICWFLDNSIIKIFLS